MSSKFMALNINKVRFFVCLQILIILYGCSATHLVDYNHKKTDFIPVLFVDGLYIGNQPLCLDETRQKWPELHNLFRDHGYELEVACIPNGDIDLLADSLYLEIKRLYENPNNNLYYKKSFHIVAKSIGGLAVRRMLSKYKYINIDLELFSNRVKSVTTISTPHKGSAIADEFMENTNCSSDNIMLTPLQQSGCDLTTESMKRFNTENPYLNIVQFYSFGYKIICDDLFCKLVDWISPLYPVNFISKKWADEIYRVSGYENDGLVSEDSAKWGIYLGTFEGEHFSETARPWSSFISYLSRYKNEWIWKIVFEKVIVNLNRIDHEREIFN